MTDRQRTTKPHPPKVLFLCYGNACRSIMAEALARHYLAEDLDACSAGIAPLGHIPQQTIACLAETGISTAGLRSKALADFPLKNVDHIVNLTEFNIARLVPRSFSGGILSHYIRDPYGAGPDAYRAARNELARFVREELPELLASHAGHAPAR